MFSGLLGAIAPTFAGRALDMLKPAFSSAFEFLTGEGVNRAAKGLESLGLSKISKGLSKIGKAAKIMAGNKELPDRTGKRTFQISTSKDLEDDDRNIDMPEDDDAEEFENYRNRKKSKLNIPNMNEPPDYLR